MRRLFLLALLCSVAAAQSPFTCARVDSPGAVRAEGLAELLPDIVLDCTGGNAAMAPSIYTLLLTVKGKWAERPPFTPPVPATSTAATSIPPTPVWNEALLLIDDPLPAAQSVCLPATNFNSCSPSAGANIFPARRLENNLIGFTEIPIAFPGDGKTRRIRIANLRVNAPLSSAKAGSISTTIQMFDYRSEAVRVAPRETVSATAQVSYALQLLDSMGTPIDEVSPALLTTPSTVPLNAPTGAVSFHAAFEEGTVAAFRRRNIATTPQFSGSLQSQNIPGLAYNTESGFFDTRLPLSNALSVAGSADSGTRRLSESVADLLEPQWRRSLQPGFPVSARLGATICGQRKGTGGLGGGFGRSVRYRPHLLRDCADFAGNRRNRCGYATGQHRPIP